MLECRSRTSDLIVGPEAMGGGLNVGVSEQKPHRTNADWNSDIPKADLRRLVFGQIRTPLYRVYQGVLHPPSNLGGNHGRA